MADVENDEAVFDLPVDKQHRATKIKLFSVKRPHMRAFHFAWFSFFLAFFGWFALSPLLVTIGKFSPDIGILEKAKRVNSNVVAVSGTIFMRLLVGPLCDRFGPRYAQSALLGIFSLPVFLVGTAFNYASFVTARFFIGFIGATFVVVQFWTSTMFSSNVVGTANAVTAGWGNLGGGATNALMPQFFNLMKAFGLNDDRAWRVAMVIPGCALLLTSIALFFLSDDHPDGQYRDMHRKGTKEKTNPFVAMGRAATNHRSWLLFWLYATCFGVELTMNSNLASYFEIVFVLDQGKAGLIAGLFGLTNLYARALGGISSDFMSSKFGMRGRLWNFFGCLFLESIMLIIFSRWKVLGGAIPFLLLFSTFVGMSAGATFGIVPFVDPICTGAVSGIVGAGGNFGGVVFNLLFRIGNDANALLYLGFIVLGSSTIVSLLHWPYYGSMFRSPSTALKNDDDNESKEDDEDDEDDEEDDTEEEEVKDEPVAK